MLSIERPSKNGMMRPMSRLRYWHLVLTANELPRDRPVGVQVAGRDIVLFRTSGGAPGALEAPTRTARWRAGAACRAPGPRSSMRSA